MGCGLCEVYCLVKHSQSKDIIKAYKKERPKPLSRVKLEVSHPLSFAIQCRHCHEALCVDACLTGAMRINDETGGVTHDEKKCIGCWTCLAACPNGALTRDIDNKVVAKCDLCAGQELPVCVANCPNEALKLIDDEEADALKVAGSGVGA